MNGFQFYSRVPGMNEDLYWHVCSVADEYLVMENKSCNHMMQLIPLGEYILKSAHYLENNQHVKKFENHTLAFPRNESKIVLNMLISGQKVSIVGLNTAIDEILTEMRALYKNTRFFRGKENLWSHTKNWIFQRYSYNQPQTELVQLMTTGIYQFWKYWLRDRRYTAAKLRLEVIASSPQPLSLSSNVAFIFVILCLGLGMSIPVFMAKFLHLVLKRHNFQDSIQFVLMSSIVKLGDLCPFVT